MKKLNTETKTVLHYAKKIKEYCDKFDAGCRKCPLSDDRKICYFFSFHITGRR